MRPTHPLQVTPCPCPLCAREAALAFFTKVIVWVYLAVVVGLGVAVWFA